MFLLIHGSIIGPKIPSQLYPFSMPYVELQSQCSSYLFYSYSNIIWIDGMLKAVLLMVYFDLVIFTFYVTGIITIMNRIDAGSIINDIFISLYFFISTNYLSFTLSILLMSFQWLCSRIMINGFFRYIY